MITVVAFDLDGVYFLGGKANFIKSPGQFGVSADEAGRVFLKRDEVEIDFPMNRGLKLAGGTVAT